MAAVQLASGPSVVPQVVVCNLKPGVTARAKLGKVSELDVFVMVTVWAALEVPMPVVGKMSDTGWKLSIPVNPPVPLRGTVAAVTVEELMVNAPVNEPLIWGAKTT
jgi:hypothetical protein